MRDNDDPTCVEFLDPASNCVKESPLIGYPREAVHAGIE